MIELLDTVHKMCIGAALVLIALKYGRGLNVTDEIMLMNIIWPIALLSKLVLQKRLKVVGNG